jgi:hypothetical protein
MMQEINLTIIGDVFCSTTRTYLTYLKDAELRPKNLWLINFTPAEPRAKKAARYFGATVGNYFHSRQKTPSAGTFSAEFKLLCGELQETAAPLPVNLFDDFEASDYASHVERFSAEDYDDAYLQRRILRTKGTAFLYTNGGIVPQKLLDHDSVKIFHIHPGVVPHVRGSDCFLWSCLVRSRPGVSCFYMSPGIDEGDVLGTMEFSTPDLKPLRSFMTPEGEDVAYRALLYSIDPHTRAMMLVKVLKDNAGADLRHLGSTKQKPSSRSAFLWMHPKLRLQVMNHLSSPASGRNAGKLAAFK